MRTRINLTIYIILLLTIAIGIFILRYQNQSIKQLNDVVKQQQIEAAIQKSADSIKFKQLELKTYSDSMFTAKLYRDRELELIKELTKKKINKYENIIKVLPNANTATRDSIWKSELAKPEQFIK